MPRLLGSLLSRTRSRVLAPAAVAVFTILTIGMGSGCATVAHLEPGPVHIVRPGDTLLWIARAYGTPVERVARANGLSNVDHILVGQEIRLPRGARLVYRAGPGETLRGIAERHAVSVAKVAWRNRDTDPDREITGRHVILPREARLLPPPRARTRPPDVAARGPDPGGEDLVVLAETLYREARFEESLEAARRARSHFAALGTRPDLQARAAFIEGCSLVAFGNTDAAGDAFDDARVVAPDYQPPPDWLSPRIFSLWRD
jgi:LysM repeat protein